MNNYRDSEDYREMDTELKAYDYFYELEVLLDEIADTIHSLMEAEQPVNEYCLYVTGLPADVSYSVVADEIYYSKTAFDTQIDLGQVFYA